MTSHTGISVPLATDYLKAKQNINVIYYHYKLLQCKKEVPNQTIYLKFYLSLYDCFCTMYLDVVYI
jgi:hypothetical protein